ncbi:MAG: nitrile hydratase subunit beta [Acidimicrobiia bacterium]|nr:nitrile hydratase subunit beta [Acidimicrobiia bacterium]
MDGVHDLGGRQGFGPVVVEQDEPVFHADWERVARAVTFAAVANVDNPSTSKFRHAIERMDPAHYLSSSYYEHWLTAAATLAVEAGLVTPEALEARAGGPFPVSQPVLVDDVAVPAQRSARFGVGDRVRVRNMHPGGHTRCPGYVRDKVGVVTSLEGEWNIPDVEAHSHARVPDAVYSVRFSTEELWGDGEPGASVNVDLWDCYLEPA